jgi:hypothetical protein
MKKLNFILILVLFNYYNLRAQHIEIVRQNNTPTQLNDLKIENNGSTIAVGYSTNNNTNGEDCYMIRLGANKQVLWAITLPNQGNDQFLKVKVCNNGDYIACGYYVQNNFLRGIVCRISANGNLVWSRTTLSLSSPNGDGYFDVIETRNGNIAVVGLRNASAPAVDGLVTLLDANGTFLWNRINNYLADFTAVFTSIIELPNSNLLVGGRFWNRGAQNSPHVLLQLNQNNGATIISQAYNLSVSVPFVPGVPGISVNGGTGFTNPRLINGRVYYDGIGINSTFTTNTQFLFNYDIQSNTLVSNYLTNNIITPTNFTFSVNAANDYIITQSNNTNNRNIVARFVNGVKVSEYSLINNAATNSTGSFSNANNFAFCGRNPNNAPYIFYTQPTNNITCNTQQSNNINIFNTTLQPFANPILLNLNTVALSIHSPQINTQIDTSRLVCQQSNPCPPDTSRTFIKCQNTALPLTVRNGTTYNWSPSTGLSATNIQNPTTVVNTNTTYLVTVTNAATGCSNVDTIRVNVNPNPISNLRDTALCIGDSIRLYATEDGNTYNWSPSYNISNINVGNPIVWPTVNTNYIVTITNSFGCTIRDTILVTANNCACEDSCNWSLTGNSNVKDRNFIGSKNAADFKIRTSNVQRMVVSANGQVGINTAAPTKLLDVNGEARVANLPAAFANNKIVMANANGDLKSLATTNNTNQYLSGNGTWQNLPPTGGGTVSASQGLTVQNENTVVLGAECGAGEGAFESNREINMRNKNLYFNSSEEGKLYMGITGEKNCKELQTRLEISTKGLKAINDYSSPTASTSGLRFTDLTAKDEPIEAKYKGVLSLDEDGDVIWVNANSFGKQPNEIKAILDRLTALETALKDSKAETEKLKAQLNQIDVTLTNNTENYLGQNVPNPFTDKTAIVYDVPYFKQQALLVISATNGKVLKEINLQKAGKGIVNIYTKDLTPGLYVYTLIVDGKTIESKKMIK